MINKMSKLLIISMLLVVMIVPAFAEDKVVDDSTAKITITNIVGQAKETINMYGESKEYDIHLVTKGAKITIESKTGIRCGVMGLMDEGDGSYYEDPWPWGGTGEFRMYIDGGMTGYNDLEGCTYYSFFYEKDGKDVNMMFKLVDEGTVVVEQPQDNNENVLDLSNDSFELTITNVVGETKETLTIDDRVEENKVYLITEGSKAGIKTNTLTYSGGGIIHNDDGYMYSDPSLVWVINGETSYSPKLEANTTAYMKFEGSTYYYFGYGEDDERVQFLLKTVDKAPVEDKEIDNTEPEPVEVVFDENDAPHNWAKGDVTVAIQKNLVPKDLQNKYQENITRQDFCQAIVQVIETKTGKAIDQVLAEVGRRSNENEPFTDTNEKFVVDAYQLKILSGRGNKIFDPNGSISRQEAAAMLTNAARVLGADTNGTDCDFTDKDSIENYALNSVNYVSSTGIMGSTGNNSFSPNSPYTRQQSYITLLRLFNNIK